MAKEFGQLIITGANQRKEKAEMEKISDQMSEDIGKAVVALIEARGVCTIHGALGILLTTVIVLMRRVPDSKAKEDMRKAMLSALAQC